MKIKSISTGFLSGNLIGSAEGDIDARAVSERYAQHLQDALEKAFPGVEIDVDWQDAYGVLPSTLKTRVEIEGEYDYAEADEIIRQVDDICDTVFTTGLFLE
jgi:hypothetical protein